MAGVTPGASQYAAPSGLAAIRARNAGPMRFCLCRAISMAVELPADGRAINPVWGSINLMPLCSLQPARYWIPRLRARVHGRRAALQTTPLWYAKAAYCQKQTCSTGSLTPARHTGRDSLGNGSSGAPHRAAAGPAAERAWHPTRIPKRIF